MELMRSRAASGSVPYVRNIAGEDRLVILPDEDQDSSTAAGRPIGAEYSSVEEKLAFMDRHEIAISVLSLANPWLDFLSPEEAVPMAIELNEQLSEMHAASRGRLYGFGTLPLQDPAAAEAEVHRMAQLPGIRGVIIGTTGRGRGLDDPELSGVWSALEAHGMVAFIHPHYGLGNDQFGGFGHSLFLALGFPFETTAAVARLILAGTLDRHPALKLLVAHSGGCLPFLAGRLNSCVEGEPALAASLEKKPSEYLKQLYYDAVIYGTPQMEMVHDLVDGDVCVATASRCARTRRRALTPPPPRSPAYPSLPARAVQHDDVRHRPPLLPARGGRHGGGALAVDGQKPRGDRAARAGRGAQGAERKRAEAAAPGLSRQQRQRAARFPRALELRACSEVDFDFKTTTITVPAHRAGAARAAPLHLARESLHRALHQRAVRLHRARRRARRLDAPAHPVRRVD